MALKWRKKALLAKIETVYGTDPTPTGAANAILATDVTLRPMEGQDVERGLDLPYLGHQGQIPVGIHAVLEYAVEMAGSGAAGTAPAYGPLLRNTGLAETVSAGVDVQYAPISASFESITKYLNIDGVRHALRGCYSNLKLQYPKNGIPKLMLTTTGLFTTVAAAALPTVDVSGFQTPLPTSYVNSPTFTLFGYAAPLISLDLDFGNQIAVKNYANSERIDLTDRKITGTAVIEAPALATKDFFALAVAKTRGAMQLIHGVGAGKVVQLDAPAVEIGRPSYSQDDGTVTLSLPLNICPDEGNDEIKITIK